MASALEATGDFRVLRRLPPRTFKPDFIPGARLALYVDVETTCLDPRQDEIIELAMVPFWYDPNGPVLGCSPLSGFQRAAPPDHSRNPGLDRHHQRDGDGSAD